jgi:cell division protein FtsQ
LGRRASLILGAAMGVAVILVVWLVAFSPVLGADTVRVTGVHLLTADQVREAAGIGAGEPLVRIDTGAVAHRVEALREVASARVRLSYPNTVTIEVTERVPIGYVGSGSGFALVDSGGVQFRSVSRPPARLPLFSVPSGSAAPAAAQAEAIVAEALPRSLRGKVASIQAFDATAITVVLTDHRIVHWGSADDSARKAQLLAAVITRPGTVFDVSDPTQVVVR